MWAIGVLLHEMLSGQPPFWPTAEPGSNRSRDLMRYAIHSACNHMHMHMHMHMCMHMSHAHVHVHVM